MKLNKNQLKELIKHTMQEIKSNNPDITEEQLAEALPAIAARVLPVVARHMAADKAIDTVTGKDEDEEVEEGKANAVKKIGKKVWDKVGPHVKDIAKQAAAGAIEKGSQAAKDKISSKLGKKQKDEGGEGSGRPTKPGSKRDMEKRMDAATADANARLDAAEKAMKAKKKKKKAKEEGRYHTQVNIPKGTWKTTVKEVKQWMRKLEENRYKKVYNADVRRVAWMVNNEGIELSAMPKSMSKKWTKAQYGRERQLATEFIKHLESKQVNETKLRESIRNIIKRLI